MVQESLQEQINEINDLLYRGNEDVDPFLLIAKETRDLRASVKGLNARMYRVELEDRKTKNTIVKMLYIVLLLLVYSLAIKFGLKDLITHLVGF